jgi:hypothetical protein
MTGRALRNWRSARVKSCAKTCVGRAFSLVNS